MQDNVIGLAFNRNLIFLLMHDLCHVSLKGDVAKIVHEKKYKVSVKGKSYDVILHQDLEDGGYWVECPVLPGCASQGDTVEEALEMIKDAIAGHIEVEV